MKKEKYDCAFQNGFIQSNGLTNEKTADQLRSEASWFFPIGIFLLDNIVLLI